MALRGNLKDFSLPDVFQLVQLSGKTGVLRIQGAEAQGSIWFRDGDVFFAQSNWRREQLGERLVSAQRITPAALSRALELRVVEPEGGRRLGEILVSEGYITQQVLETFVQEQIQDTIFDLMRWDEGEFDFEVLPEIVNEDIGLTVSVENIVMEGSRRLEEWQRIKKKVPSTEMVFKMATAPGEGTFEISLKPIEWTLLLLIDGTRSVRELAIETHSTDFEVARVVYGLFSAGLLEVPSDEEIERLRADRARREDKRAALEAERAAREAEQQAEALGLEASLVAEAEARRAADSALVPQESESEAVAEAPVAEAPEASAVAEPRRIVEEPEFLVVGAEAPSSEDIAVFEQMMASVLSPEVTGETSPETATEPELMVVPELDLEPEPEPEAEVVPEPEPEVAPEPEPEVAPEPEPEVAPEPEPEVVPEPEVALEPELEVVPAVTPEFEIIPGLGFPPESEIETEAQPLPELTTEQLEAALAGESAPAIEAEPTVAEVAASRLLEEDVFGFGALSEADLGNIPAPPIAESAPLPEGFAPTGDFEADLRSLGLGEFPEELLEPEPPVETRLPMSELGQETGHALVPELGPELEPETAPEAEPETESEPALEVGVGDEDLESLLASLESEPASAGVISSETDYGADGASEGVISTDAFLAEFEDVGLSGGLGDELTALTGGASGRSRPVATVTKLPESGEVHMLHRDQMVDRSLLEKIIEGVENL